MRFLHVPLNSCCPADMQHFNLDLFNPELLFLSRVLVLPVNESLVLHVLQTKIV